MPKREMITHGQLKKIWATANGNGISEERLREIIEGVSGQRSTKQLTKPKAKKVIDILEGRASLPVHKDNSKVFALATPPQLNLIRDLQVEADWTDEHLNSYILKYFKRDYLRRLNRQQAGVVIAVLKKEKQKKREAA